MNSATNKIIHVTELNFSYEDKTILDSLTFELEKGEIAVFLGKQLS